MPVDCREDGTAAFALKNRFFKGEELELLQPGHCTRQLPRLRL